MDHLITRILIVLMLNVWMLSSQITSSCRYFEYRYESSGVYGYIEVNLNNHVSTILTIVNLTVAAHIPNDYTGTIEYLGLQRRNDASVVKYKVHFPVSNPVPKLTALIVNNNELCSATGDVIRPGGGYITRIGLSHVQYLGSSFYDDISLPSKPVFKDPFPTNFDVILQSTIGNASPNRNKDWETDFFSYTQPSNSDRRDPPVRPRPSFKPPAFSPDTYPPPMRPVQPPVYEEPAKVEAPRPITTTTQKTTAAFSSPPPTSSNSVECGVVSGPTTLIYNGDRYDRGEWPWLVALYRRKDLSFICGGTLVSDLHVITAAHCMQQKSSFSEIKDIMVRVGVFNLDDLDDDHTVTRFLASARIHESYNAETVANDILILTFTKKVTYTNYIRPICLWTGKIDLNEVVGREGVVAGWGKSDTGPSGKGEPRAVRIPIVSTSTCRSSRPDFSALTSSYTLCAGNQDGSGPCLGDSGGGLYVHNAGRWRLRGIVSVSLRPDNGDYNCNLDAYLVFTDSAQYLPWIHSNLDVKKR